MRWFFFFGCIKIWLFNKTATEKNFFASHKSQPNADTGAQTMKKKSTGSQLEDDGFFNDLSHEQIYSREILIVFLI